MRARGVPTFPGEFRKTERKEGRGFSLPALSIELPTLCCAFGPLTGKNALFERDLLSPVHIADTHIMLSEQGVTRSYQIIRCLAQFVAALVQEGNVGQAHEQG